MENRHVWVKVRDLKTPFIYNLKFSLQLHTLEKLNTTLNEVLYYQKF